MTQQPPAGGSGSVARAPLTKNARHSRVAALLAGRPVRSQQELGHLLAAQGVHVTQATLSRDLGELGAYKVRTSDGGLVYALPDGVDRGGRSGGIGAAQLARRLEELLLSAEAVAGNVVLRTPPGGAHLLASSIDAAELPEVAGTIAGDDTVLLICRTLERPGTDVAEALAERLLAAADGLARGPAEPRADTQHADAQPVVTELVPEATDHEPASLPERGLAAR